MKSHKIAMKRLALFVALAFIAVSAFAGCGGGSGNAGGGATSQAATTTKAVATEAATTAAKETEAATTAKEAAATTTAATTAAKAAETTAAEAPAEGVKPVDDIIIVQSLDMNAWDPVNTSDLGNGYIINNVYSKLFTFDENINGIPELCESYNLIGETEWHFKIYPNVKCHDGSVLTADDVVYSLNRTKEGTAIGALFGPVEEISKVDDLTISIKTKGPYPALPTALTHQATCIVPKHYSEKAEADGDWSKPIGSGRYVFTNRVIGDSIKVTRFDDYFNKEDSARNNSLTWKIIPEGTSRTIAIETGEADLNIDFDTVGYNQVKNNPDLKLWEHYSQTVWHLGMDNTHEWFSNKLVRQAVNFAVDRAACLEVGHNGHGTVVFNCATFAPTCLGAIDNPLNMYSYDPEKAKELMAQAGCPGFETDIIVFRDETERIATLCQQYLAEINIKANVKRIENAVFASTIQAHEAPMFITSWGAYWDPDLFLARRFSQAGIGGVNRVFYLNPELDVLILEGRGTFDIGKRIESYKKVQEFLAVEAPECDLYVSIMFALAKKDLQGVEINVERPFNFYKLHY